MPIKRIGHLNIASQKPIPTFATFHIASSEFFKYIQAAAFSCPPSQVHVTGLPRCDAFTQIQACQKNRSQVAQALSLDSSQKLVVWLPTYRLERGAKQATNRHIQSFVDDLPVNAMAAISEAAARHNCKVIIKLHPYDRSDQAELSTEQVRVFSHSEWTKLNIQLYDLLAASDALMSDVSSVLIDYLSASKPIGVIGFDADNYKRGTTFDPALLLQSNVFSALDNTADIERFFALASKGKTLKLANNDVAQMFYQTQAGSSAEKILRLLDSPTV